MDVIESIRYKGEPCIRMASCVRKKLFLIKTKKITLEKQHGGWLRRSRSRTKTTEVEDETVRRRRGEWLNVRNVCVDKYLSKAWKCYYCGSRKHLNGITVGGAVESKEK